MLVNGPFNFIIFRVPEVTCLYSQDGLLVGIIFNTARQQKIHVCNALIQLYAVTTYYAQTNISSET